jgi:hypothetical protein
MARSAAHRGDGGTQKGRIRGARGGREALVDVCCSATSDAVVLTCAPPRLELHHHAPDAAPDGAKAETCSLERHWQWINVGEKKMWGQVDGGWKMEKNSIHDGRTTPPVRPYAQCASPYHRNPTHPARFADTRLACGFACFSASARSTRPRPRALRPAPRLARLRLGSRLRHVPLGIVACLFSCVVGFSRRHSLPALSCGRLPLRPRGEALPSDGHVTDGAEGGVTVTSVQAMLDRRQSVPSQAVVR